MSGWCVGFWMMFIAWGISFYGQRTATKQYETIIEGYKKMIDASIDCDRRIIERLRGVK